MVQISPGVRYLRRKLLPPLSVLLIGTYILALPLWASLVLLALGIPGLTFGRYYYHEVKWRWEAAALGARLPPRMRGKRIGNIDVMKNLLHSWRTGYLGDYFVDLITNMGPMWDLHMLWDGATMTVSPQHIQAILATDFASFEKGWWFQDLMGSVLGAGVFNADGDMWKFHRSMARPFFTRDRITHFELFDRHAHIAISQMKQRFSEGYAVDFQEVVSRFTMDSATEFLFGASVDSLKDALPYPHYIVDTGKSRPNGFARAFLLAQDVLAERHHKGWTWPLFEMKKDESEEHMKVVTAFIDPIVEAALAKKRSMNVVEKTADIEEDDTLLDHLLKQTSDAKVIKDETLNILLAGRDTTAATLTFVVYFLAMYPVTMARLREEILSKVGPERAPTFEDIKEMKFLRAVINETLRLYPAVPFNMRECVKATTLPSENPEEKPYYIPSNTNVSYSVYLMQRRKDLWGPDADEFDPDRFLDERLKKYLIPNPFIFLPFNAGPRICLGQQFAYNEISFMIVRLLQNFSSFSLDEEAFSPESRPPSEWRSGQGRQRIEKFYPRVTLTTYSAGGMWVKGIQVDSEGTDLQYQ